MKSSRRSPSGSTGKPGFGKWRPAGDHPRKTSFDQGRTEIDDPEANRGGATNRIIEENLPYGEWGF